MYNPNSQVGKINLDKMGNTSSSDSESRVWANLQKIKEDNPDYMFYKFKDGFFVLEYSQYEDFVEKVYITEVIPLKKKEESVKEIYLDSKEKAYKIIPDNVKEGIPYIEIKKFSDWVYLGYLYASKKRTGKFIESLIVDISKKLKAKGIHLIDASRAGKCSNISLSLQLFISDSKKHMSYYETLGYKRETREYKDKVKLTKKLMESIEKIPMKTFADEIHKHYIDNQNEKHTYRNNTNLDIFAIGYILKEEKNLQLNALEYIKMLIDRGRCYQVNILIDRNFILYDKSPIAKFLTYLEDISYGTYIKQF